VSHPAALEFPLIQLAQILTSPFAPWRKSVIHFIAASSFWFLSPYILCIASEMASKSSKQGSQSLCRSRSQSTGSVICVCLCAGSGWLFHVLRRVAAYLTVSGSLCGNTCTRDWKLDCKALRELSSSVTPLQYHSGLVISKIFFSLPPVE